MPRATLSYFEIPARDPDALAEFFRAAFGWDALAVAWDGPRYLRLLPPPTVEPPGGGILARDASGLVESLTVMIRVEGEPLEAALARVTGAGGAVALAPTEIGDFGRYARFTDPEGNSFGLWQSRDP